MRSPHLLAACTAVLASALSFCTADSYGQTAVSKPTQLSDPRKATAAQLLSDPATTAWQFFVFVNWPELSGNRGVPDPNRAIGDPGATVWESFKNESEIYLLDGSRPPAWEVENEIPMASLHKTTSRPPAPRSARPTAKQLADYGPVDSNWLHFLAEPIMVDGQQICDADSNVVEYDVRSNRPYFDYVVNNPAGYPLYNLQGQAAALADSNFTFNFPADTLEVKASWRILEPGVDPSRYWTAIGVYYDDKHNLKIARIGLTGLHIISKKLPNWLWITFEQIDNPTTTYKYFLGQKGAAIGANINYNPAVAPINQLWQQALAGTKWQYYALMNTQTQFVNQSQQPTLLGNTQMETYFQPGSSCISCHALSSIGPKQNPRLDFLYNHSTYTGIINFQSIAAQQYPGQTFKDMDFAWSLRNAHNVAISTKKKKPRTKTVAVLEGPRLNPAPPGKPISDDMPDNKHNNKSDK